MGSVRLSVSDAPVPSARLTEALGLVPLDDDALRDASCTRLKETGTLWPVVVAGLLLGSIGIASTLAIWHAPVALATGLGLAMAVIGLFTWGVLRLPAAQELASHHRIIMLACSAAALAIALSLQLSLSPSLPTGPLRVAGFVLGIGGIVLTAIALHPVRAASLVFAVTLALMVPVSAGIGLAAVAAVLLAALLAIGMGRVAMRDLEQIGVHEAEERERRLTTRLVQEYESHGTGWFWQTDRAGRLNYVSAKVARELTAIGMAPQGQRLVDVFRVDSSMADTERTLTFHLSARSSFSDYSVGPAFETDADRWWSISGRPMLDDLGRFQGFIGFGSDLTEKRRSEAEITRLALFDSLTGLANRQRLRLSLDQALATAQGPNTTTALFLLDLDRFKAVNDTLGHQCGDELLKQVAQRLTRTVEDAGLVGRLGGDEFQVVLPREGNRDRLGTLAQQIITALSQPFFIAGSSLSIGCSIGIAIAPEHGQDSETLIRNADLALYAAKADGRGVSRFFRDEMLAGAQKRKRLEDDLRRALGEEEFHLVYQPVVSTKDQRIVGYEALLRWEHPTRGLVSPADFVPVAEECGMIEAIGEWVLRTACAEAAKWPAQVRIAVNVSPIQFANPALPAIVTSAIASSGIAASRLELEITESVFVNDDAFSSQMFKTLKGIGVRLALDDFGTGYSSLGYLRKAPFDKIKIDQSFVRGAIQAGNRNAAIIKAIVTLADTLGMETTAEGVEQQDEITLIRDLGCSHIQGFVYGRPARAEDARAQLASGGADAGGAKPVGHRVSRAARATVLRSAKLEIGGESGEVRIRNLSATGVMIDGVDFPDEAIGAAVRIELVDNEMFPATIRWISDGRAGLEFARHFDMERLSQPPARVTRRAG
ncbi:EAL domain-containing protein [Sphingomonas dokdonensis]|uniref:Cyclic di-GMP phosphodiesterase Gmr n=1 Tax=Sphingomonas dokdonensis TaxID=344880 RepID=A0A245ZU79_9SPHN|nr:EAL domain-containing protein [Sphingomonas dokdonensis]OWK33303.1 cyclic di-GMP phosphodiesterase Gmr [Sphingomonas dokdonensis]